MSLYCKTVGAILKLTGSCDLMFVGDILMARGDMLMARSVSYLQQRGMVQIALWIIDNQLLD